MVEFAHIHREWIGKWIRLPNGIPVQQTMINLFSLIDPVQFSQCIIEHLRALHPTLAKQLIAVDGKTIRGSGKTNYGVLAAYDMHSTILLPFEERSFVTVNGKSSNVFGRVRTDFGEGTHLGFVATDRRYDDGGNGTPGGTENDSPCA